MSLPIAAAILAHVIAFWPIVTPAQAESPTERVAEIGTRSIVFVTIQSTSPNGVLSTATGTGFVVSSEGYVVTASHLLAKTRDSEQISGSIGSRFSLGTPMTIISNNPEKDVLILKFKQAGLAFHPVTFGRSETTRSGAELIAVGFRLESNVAVVAGTLSNKDGPAGTWETTLPLNHGDSGGPVFDRHAKVVGIAAGGIGGAQLITFVQPIRHIASELLEVGVDLNPDVVIAPPPEQPPPKIISFTVLPRFTHRGDRVRATWETVNASACQLSFNDDEPAEVNVSGERRFTARSSAVTLHCSGGGRDVTSSRRIEFRERLADTTQAAPVVDALHQYCCDPISRYRVCALNVPVRHSTSCACYGVNGTGITC